MGNLFENSHYTISLGYIQFDPVTVHQLFKFKHYLKLESPHILRKVLPKIFFFLLLICIFVVKFYGIFLVLFYRCMSACQLFIGTIHMFLLCSM